MRFAFSDEQLEARAHVRSALERLCPPSVVRARWADGPPPDRSLWESLAQIGLPGALLPHGYGGMGGGVLDLVLLLEEAGRVALPEPLSDTALVAARLLDDAAPRDFSRAWLPRVASGEAIVSVCLGGSPFALDADRADLLLIERGGRLHAVERGEAGLVRQASVDGARRLFRVDFTPTRSTQLAPWPAGGEGGAGLEASAARVALEAAADRASLGASAELLGLGRRMLEMTAEYVKVRHQFGVPVGSFQAVKHALASSLVAVEMARPAVHRAAYAIDRGELGAAMRVSAAKAAASEAALLAGRAALQCHGAIGYSYEHDLHLFLKRAWALAAAHGDAAWHRERVARHVLGAPAAGPNPNEAAGE